MHLILDPLSPTDNRLPLKPTHIASWSIDSPAGPSRRIALASADNSIWIHTSPLLPPADLTPPAPSQPLPSIITSPPPRGTSSLPNARHKQRSRATSSTSSILTKSSKRRAAAFSPPSSAVQLPATSLASATALPAVHDEHGRNSISEHDELLEHLREQAKAEEEESRLSRLSGMAKRGLPGLHGKEEHELVEGTTSPRSTVSVDSSRTFTDIFSWKRGDEEERRQKELKEKITEIDVEREIERETREEAREQQETKVIEAASRHDSKPRHKRTKTLDLRSEVSQSFYTLRIVLPEPDRGKIACMKVFEGVGLVILRDIGLLDVYSLTDLKRIQSVNLESSNNIASSSKSLHLSPFWFWRTLHTVDVGKHTYIVADGIPWPCGMPSPNGEVTHIVIVPSDPSNQNQVAHLDLPGVGHVGTTNAGTLPQPHLLHFLPDTLTSYPIRIASPTANPSAPPERRNSPLPRSVTAAFTSQNLSLLRPSTPGPQTSREPHLKKSQSSAALRPGSSGSSKPESEDRGLSGLLGRRKAPKSPTVPEPSETTVELGEGKEVERDGYGQWVDVTISSNGEGIGWTDEAVDMITCDGVRLSVNSSITLAKKSKVAEVRFSAGWRNVIVRTTKNVLLYHGKELGQRLPAALCLELDDRNTSVLLATSGELSCYALSSPSDRPNRIIELCEPDPSHRRASVVPLQNDRGAIIDSSGNASLCTFSDIISGKNPEQQGLSADRLDARVTVTRPISTLEEYLLAGDEDGVVRVWTAGDFELQGSWTCFADPVHAIALVEHTQSTAAPCLFCVSENGTIALIDLEIMDLLYLIPASRAPLRRAFVGGNDLLLAYANGKARVWNLKTCEFRRSTGLDAADDMLQSGEWVEIDMHAPPPAQSLSAVHAISPAFSDLGRMLQLDLRAFEQSVQRSTSGSPLALARNLLSLILTWDVDQGIDRICTHGLGIQRSKSPVGVSISLDDAVFISAEGIDLWQISPEATAMRQLYIVTLLRTFLNSPDHEKAAAEVIAHYTVTILDVAVPPDLEFFAVYYMDPIANIQQSARMLFAARLNNMTEGQIEAVVDTHQQNLPKNLPTDLQQAEAATQALALIGAIAVHQYESLSPVVLKDVAESIHLYIADVTCAHLGIAIELASKAFTTWQTYLDPMEMLRLLFYLSTHTPPSAAISAQARIAVLHVASTNPALFMSTLSMDILDAKTTEGRTSIMKLCVYMARKNPSVLENGLPRIAEAVVKSLDPNIGKMREDVREAATVILNELVLAFTTIDFHSTTQRLAVGTHEGAIIMYDLKSASRLYVLEAHRSPVSSVNFSPDGRRLLTVSLEDGDVTVWKVGSSLSGFFNVGGPPRQGAVGSGKGGPFKRIQFKRADDGPLEEISALSDIKVEWLGERKARVMIKETALTFET